MDSPDADYSTWGDEALIQAIAGRETGALSALYDRYARLVFSLAWQSTGERETAEEITQDVFYRVWENAATYRPEQAKVSTWLTSIARNRSIDMLRRRKVRPEQNSVGWDDLAPHQAPTDEQDPALTAEQALQARRVRTALASLPQDQQRALHLAFFGGLSHAEIAEQLSEPLGTVKTRIRLAMQKLRQALYEDLPVQE